jgi:membrane protein YqaA with SNARE-associated domain
MSAIALFGVLLAGGFLPGVGSELLVVGTAALVDRPAAIGLILVAAAGQSAGKALVYMAAAAGRRALPRGGQGMKWLNADPAGSRRRILAVVFVSALASVPPLYATAIACGIARSGCVRFGLTVFLARTIRYAAIVATVNSAWTGLQ